MLLLCPGKRSKDGKRVVRRFERCGSFECATADAADDAVRQIQAVLRQLCHIGRAKAILAIVNPKAGKGKGTSVWQPVGHALHCAGCRVQVEQTDHQQHAIELSATADLSQVGCIAVVGGDGTFHEVVQVRHRHNCKCVCSA